jgi:C1A family cysteine protease
VTEPQPPSPRKIARYGWIPDLPDARDHLYAAPPRYLTDLPASTDLRAGCPKEIYDQGNLGSCTANAIGAAFEFALLKQQLDDFMPSRLFIYYNERVMEGTVDSDSGAMIRDGIKSVAKQGVCPETEWPYDISTFTDTPSDQCYRDALAHQVTSYQRVPQVLNQVKGCLAHGFPVVFGFTVYESFESDQVARSGVVPMPASGEQVLGGHAVLAVGYDDADQRFLVRNSWGDKWGQGGYFTMPYAYLVDRSLAQDFWTIQQVES